MCGIIGYVGNQDPKPILIEGLRRLEYRGYDSAGLAIVEEHGVSVFRSVGRIDALDEKVRDRQFKGQVGIGHTRWATHGSPVEANAHPHQVGSITLVHNGIIENYADLTREILQAGRSLKSETDSEIVAHLVDIEVQSGKTLEESMLSVLPRLRGAYALVLLSDKAPDQILGVRRGAPLLVGVGEKEHFLASDIQALISRTNKVVYLNEGEFVVCRADGFRIRDVRGEERAPKISIINWTPEQVEKQGYKHYMLKEIYEQPQAIANTIEGNVDHTQGVIVLKELPWNEDKLRSIQRIVIVACGTARHAALVGKAYFERMAGLPVEVEYASEFRYADPVLPEGSLCLAISQSGETLDTLSALRAAKAQGVPTLAVCNVRESSIAREADAVLYTHAGPEIGVASTKAFTTQLVLLQMFAIQLGTVRKCLTSQQAAELTTDLLRLPTQVEAAMGLAEPIQKFIVELQGYRFFFFLGRGIQAPIALEAALKLKEISYLHAEGYPAGELKHGPIALVDREHVTVVIAPKDRPYESWDIPTLFESGRSILHEKMISNLQEVKARGGKIISIGSSEDGQLSSASWFYLDLPQSHWASSPILASIPLQLFAYHVALQRGTDVDKPRNLAKSVTVE